MCENKQNYGRAATPPGESFNTNQRFTRRTSLPRSRGPACSQASTTAVMLPRFFANTRPLAQHHHLPDQRQHTAHCKTNLNPSAFAQIIDQTTHRMARPLAVVFLVPYMYTVSPLQLPQTAHLSQLHAASHGPCHLSNWALEVGLLEVRGRGLRLHVRVLACPACVFVAGPRPVRVLALQVCCVVCVSACECVRACVCARTHVRAPVCEHKAQHGSLVQW